MDFKNLSIKDLNDIECVSPDVLKALGNVLYRNAETIEQESFAKVLHSSGEIELSKEELTEIIEFVDETCKQKGIEPFFRKGIINFLKHK